MTVNEIRARYLAFFEERGHRILPSASLVPENDPTTLFVSSGMQPLLPYFLGAEHPMGKRIANSQKNLRTQDINEIGDNRHTTFFEMLGNWSFGDYFKEEEVPWIFQFLTNELAIPVDRLFVSCFEGDSALGLAKDEESAELWKKLGIPGWNIYFYGAEKNWWSRAGTPANMPPGEPGGPDTEIFYDFGTPHDEKFGEVCHPNCDCGRFMEIGNSVFMMFIKNVDGSFSKLPSQNVDFGGGLERMAAAANNTSDVFLVDTLQLVIRELAAGSGKNYGELEYIKSFRVVADHLRAAIFLISDGVTPSNTERGYVLRRLIRRAVRHMDQLGVREGTVGRVVDQVISTYREQYPELTAAHSSIVSSIQEEERKFRKTLAQGLKEFERFLKQSKSISGANAFLLFTTYGFPLEMTEELTRERGGIIVPEELAQFERLSEEHKNKSRAGAGQKFAGGLADHSEATVRYHTTHHILLRALQQVLGTDVHQRGSNITAERLRMDFSFARKMTEEERQKVERIVNEIVELDLPVIRTVMLKQDAENLGAEHEFGVSYPEMVSVYSVGPKGATESDPKISESFSRELCGGPHVANTSEIRRGGRFKIVKEEAVSSGVRRIKAVIE